MTSLASALQAISRAHPWIPAWARLEFDSSPARIRSGRNICLALGGSLFAFSMAYQCYAQRAFEDVGVRHGPALVAAEKLRHSLAQAHASALGAAALPAAEREPALALARAALARARIAQDQAAREPGAPWAEFSASLSESIGAYDQALGSAAARGFDAESVAQADAAAAAASADASKLAGERSRALSAAASAHQKNAVATAWPAMALALALAWALAWAQIDMSRLANRALNKGYLAASAAFAAFFVAGAFSTLASEASLGAARTESFESLRVLWDAKATAEQARAARAGLALASGSPGPVQARLAQWSEASRKLTPVEGSLVASAIGEGRKLGGLFGEAIAEAAYPGEREALAAMAAGWGAYANAPLAQLESMAKDKAGPGTPHGKELAGSPEDFARFSAGLEDALAINQRAFDQEVAASLHRLGLLPWLALAMLAALAAGCALGAQERLDEFQF